MVDRTTAEPNEALATFKEGPFFHFAVFTSYMSRVLQTKKT